MPIKSRLTALVGREALTFSHYAGQSLPRRLASGRSIQVAADQRKHGNRGILSEDAIDMPMTWNFAAFVKAVSIRFGQAADRPYRALRPETRIVGAMNEQRRNGHAVDVREIGILTILIEHRAFTGE